MTSVFANSAAPRVYLAVLSPYDPAASATLDVYVGSRAFVTEPGDAPANVYFAPVLREALTFERSMFRSGSIGGRSLPNWGSLVIVNTGELDDWLGYHWDGRAVTVYAGDAGDAWADFSVIFEGVIGDFSYARNTIELALRDRQTLLDKLVQGSLFAGTGGNEGGDDLKAKPKPVCLGECYNVPALLVDSASNVYQVNDGAIEAINAVYDNGKLLTLTTDYTVDLANGRFTLTAAAAGLITADIEGDKTGGVYAASAGAVIRRLVVRYGDLADPGDLDTAAFAALESATSAVVGAYLGTTPANLADVLDQVAGSVGAFWGFNRAGLFTVGRFEAASGAAGLVLDEADLVKNSLSRDSYGSPHWRERIDYKRVWAVQLPDTLDAATTDAYKDLVGQEYRTEAAEDADIKADGVGKGGFAGAVDLEPARTLLVAQADAAAEAARLLALYGTRRDVFRATAKTQPFVVDLGAVVTLTHSRFGLAAGRDFVIVGLRENAASSEVELELWG